MKKHLKRNWTVYTIGAFGGLISFIKPDYWWACIIVFGIAVVGVETPELPAFEMESLLTVLLGMLGLGGLRTFEKTKNIAREK